MKEAVSVHVGSGSVSIWEFSLTHIHTPITLRTHYDETALYIMVCVYLWSIHENAGFDPWPHSVV